MNDITVTDIRVSEKGGLFSVYSQRGFEFSLSAKGLTDSGIREGSVFSEEEFDRISAFAAREKVYRHAVYLLGFRGYSSAELLEKLSRCGEDGTEAVARLEAEGYIDDGTYAEDIIEKYRNKYGPGRVREELRRRGIPSELWRDKLQAAYADPVQDIVERISEKLRGNAVSDKKERDRLFSFLIRRGYSSEDVKRAMTLYFEQEAGEYSE